MRHIKRLSSPSILSSKQATWTSDFIAKNKPRPDSSKYANSSIKSDLFTMSHGKCYYCEKKLSGSTKEVDHFIEVSERKDLAFSWDNLYLACDNCNGKVNNLSIPVTSVLDPCKHSDDEIEKEICFEDEIITVKGNSIVGLDTIKKYKLDSELLDLLRTKKMKEFYSVYCAILEDARSQSRSLSESEKDTLRSFSSCDKPYSLMFRNLLFRKGLL